MGKPDIPGKGNVRTPQEAALRVGKNLKKQGLGVPIIENEHAWLRADRKRTLIQETNDKGYFQPGRDYSK